MTTPLRHRLLALSRTAWQTWDIVRLAAGRQLTLTLCLQVVGVLALLGQLLFGKAMLEGLTGRGGAASVTELGPSLLGLGLCTAAASASSVAVVEARRVLFELVRRHLAEEIIAVVVGVDLERLEDPDFHDRHQRALSAFVDRPYDLVNGLTALTGAVLGVATIATVLVPIAPWVLLGALAVAVPAAWVSSRTTRELYDSYSGLATMDRQRDYLTDVLTAPRTAAEIRLFDAHESLLPQLGRLYDRRIETLRLLSRSRTTRLVTLQVLTAVGAVAIVAVLVHLASRGELTVAELGLTAVGVQQLMQRLQAANSGMVSLHESSLFLGDLTSFLRGREPRREGFPGEHELPGPVTSLSLDRVTFAYPGTERVVLDEVSLELRKGEIAALVGPNGAGKTTLLKLLCGLYSPTTGAILTHSTSGSEPRELPRESLHRLVTAVFQDFGRYALTARDNIVIGDYSRAHDEARLRAAARQAGVLDLIDAMPHGFETILSRDYEGGIELSVGQWQRIALARAFFRAAPFVVLDEPTAAADALHEQLFFEEMRRHTDRAVLLITHRLSSARQADRIHVLEGGRIVETGDHESLIRDDGVYATMLRLQGEGGASVSTP